jgi:hypothetical protein
VMALVGPQTFVQCPFFWDFIPVVMPKHFLFRAQLGMSTQGGESALKGRHWLFLEALPE